MIFYSNKIQTAIRFAERTHRGQTRKVNNEPYITHPLAVVIILARVDADEKTIIAGLLHDTIEDADKNKKDFIKKQIQKLFGQKVTKIVNHLTEPDKNLPWEQRKQQALGHIFKMDKKSILVKSADILHNLSDLVCNLQTIGIGVFKYFNAPQEKQMERYQKIIEVLNQVWKENPLLPEIKKNFKLLKTEVKYALR